MQEQNTEYTYEHYVKIHNTVLEYQKGNPKAAEELIESFNGFIWKFVNCIHYGTFPLDNQCLRKFISLYVTDESMKRQITQYRFKHSVREHIFETGKKVQYLFSQYGEIEIRNELICTLLGMAKKYKDYSKPSFHNYVEKCFHFEAFRGLNYLINDPVARASQFDMTENSFIDDSVEKEFENSIEEAEHELALSKATIPVEQCDVSPFDMNSLNINWINGITCGDVFKSITPFERKLLILHYINKLTDSQIAERFGFCRATVNRKRLAAKLKLQEFVNSDMLGGNNGTN